jgi:hypothetical protein
MKSSKESLQRLTDAEEKAHKMLRKAKVEIEDIKGLSDKEIKVFLAVVNRQLKELKGEALDELYEKIDLLRTEEDKNRTWERNHHTITWAISTLMQEYGRMPTASEIAQKSELSRQTVHKHLKEYAKDERYLETVEQFRFMSSKVLARVFKFAVNGDMRAAKLYFEVAGNLGKQSPAPVPITNTQNNYIQVNQVRLSQESIEQLPADQLSQLEALLRTVIKSQ